MSIVLVGSTSGSITLQEPAVAGTTVLSLPAVTGTILTTTSPKAGNVIQVVQAINTTNTSTSSGSFVDTSLSASITPTSATSKILVLVTHDFYFENGGADNGGTVRLVRDSTAILTFGDNALYMLASSLTTTSFVAGFSFNYLDSPATTSSTTYKTQMKAQNGSTMHSSINSNPETITLMEIAA